VKLIFAAALLLATMHTAQGCSCAKAEPAFQAVRKAVLAVDKVVLAEAVTVDEIHTINEQRVTQAEFDARHRAQAMQDQDPEAVFNVRQLVQWRVVRTWKGNARPGMTLETDTRVLCCTCGEAVLVGQRRILYLKDDAVNALSTCGVGHVYSMGTQSRALARLVPRP
jgi:hypothetical protein